MDRLVAMEAFATVAKLGSFAAAAGRLRMSSTAVSRHVSNLEDHLGVRLINRTTRRLSLTEVGTAYLERSREILTDIDDLERTAQERQDSPRGTLKITAPISFGCFHLMPAIAAFMERHPDLSVDLTLGDRYFDLVEEGYEVAVRIGHLPDSSLIARKLAPSHLVVYATPAYLEERGAPDAPASLDEHDLLVFARCPDAVLMRLMRDDEVRELEVDARMSANDFDALATVTTRHWQQKQWKLNVLVCRQNRYEIMRLKDVAHVGRSPMGLLRA